MPTTNAHIRRPWPAPRTSLPAIARNRQAWVALARGGCAAFLLPVVAYFVQQSLWWALAPFAWFLFYPVIFFAPRVGGLWSGIAATFVSVGLVWWRFLPPEKSFLIKNQNSILSVVLFAAMGITFSFFQRRLRVAERSAHTALRDLQRSERRKEEYLATVADPVVIVGEEGLIEYTNAQAEKVLGYDANELIGLPHELLVPEPMRAAHGRLVRHFFEAPVASSMASPARQLVARRKDGSEFPVELSLNPISTARGTMLSTVFRDVSERRRLEDSSRLQAERLTAAIESIPDPFWIVDRDGRLATFNATFRRMLSEVGFEPEVGMEHERVIEATKALFMPMTEQERAQFLAQRAEARRTGSDCYDVDLAAGRTFRVNTSTMPDGGLVTVAFDRTEELRRASELEQARAEAEAASDAKSEFLASMSHELRTPLNAVLGFAELLKRSTTEPLSERQRRMVDHVMRGGRQLLSLVDEVLDLARIEAKGVTIAPEAVSLSPVVEEVLATLRPTAVAAGVDLGCDSPVDATLAADRARFAQILFNLGSNAIKYNRRGGSVRFEAALSARSVRIVVTDTGLGIPAAKQANLFQPFYRAGQEAGPIAGTGIGLTICKRLAESMHGSIGYQSLPNGSQFWVELPRMA